MLVSVVIPVYNVWNYLEECVSSVLNQTYVNLEVILVDDGSTDGSSALCDELAKVNSRVRVIHKENGGLSDARNYGLSAAIGEYVIFLDSDDYWNDEQGIEKLVKKALLGADMVVFKLEKLYEFDGHREYKTPFDSQNRLSKDEFLLSLDLKRDYIVSANTQLTRRSLLIDNKIVFEKGLLGEDLDWSLKLIPHINQIETIDSNFYVYRQRKGSISKKLSRKNLTDTLNIIEHWSGRIQNQTTSTACKTYQYGMIANAYMVALSMYDRIDKKERQDLYKRLKKSKDVLQHSQCVSFKRLNRLINILPLRLIMFGLGSAVKLKYKEKG